MIKVTGLTKHFGEQRVLNNISFEVLGGDVFGIVGHSGAGKSTLLRCLNGLEPYDGGSVKVMGQEVGQMEKEDLRFLRREMGMIFQNFNLMSRKDVFGNVAFPLEVWKTPKDKIKDRVMELLDLVGLKEKVHERIDNLSGGQKQRVGIARALALNPKILLCDEATSALDPQTTISILELLMDINQRLNLTIVLVTHQMEVVKMVCNKVLILDKGESRGCDETEKLFLSPTPELKRLIKDEYAFIPSGINIRLMFPRDIAKESVITSMARALNVDFSIIGGRLERYREDVLGFLIINVRDEDLDKILKYLEENHLYWQVMEDGE